MNLPVYNNANENYLIGLVKDEAKLEILHWVGIQL